MVDKKPIEDDYKTYGDIRYMEGCGDIPDGWVVYLSKAKEVVEALEDAHAHVVKEYSDELEKRHNTIKDLEKQLADERGKVKNLGEGIRKNNDQSQENYKNMGEIISQVKKEKEKLENKVHALEGGLMVEEEETEKLEQEKKALEDDLKVNKADVENLRVKVSEYEEKVTELEQNYGRLISTAIEVKHSNTKEFMKYLTEQLIKHMKIIDATHPNFPPKESENKGMKCGICGEEAKWYCRRHGYTCEFHKCDSPGSPKESPEKGEEEE